MGKYDQQLNTINAVFEVAKDNKSPSDTVIVCRQALEKIIDLLFVIQRVTEGKETGDEKELGKSEKKDDKTEKEKNMYFASLLFLEKGKLIEDKELAKKLGESARKISDRVNEEAIIAQWKKYIEHVTIK